MCEIVLPERVVLWVCPNHHPDKDRLVITAEDAEYYIVRMIWYKDGHEYHYLTPPPSFVIALLRRMHDVNPGGIIGVSNHECAECLGFKDPGLWRRKFRIRPRNWKE